MTKAFKKYSTSLATRGMQVKTVLRAHPTRQNSSHVENEVCNMEGYLRFLRKNEVTICREMHAARDNHITATGVSHRKTDPRLSFPCGSQISC